MHVGIDKTGCDRAGMSATSHTYLYICIYVYNKIYNIYIYLPPGHLEHSWLQEAVDGIGEAVDGVGGSSPPAC